MNLKILLYNWKIEFDSNDGSYTVIMERIIMFEDFKDKSQEYIKRVIKHEIVHALLSELGQSQNQLGNGRNNDSFDSEYVCELIAIYGNYIEELSIKVFNKALSI